MIVLSHDGFNQTPTWRSVIVIPISTTALQATRGPTVLEIASGVAGLRRPGLAICHEVTTVDRSKLTTRIGALPDTALEEAGNGLRVALDLIE
ncbi:MAG: type II toxin-antitoxin system PemK/MazF family toxin [Acidobacteria bacterium]|nr:type II toxin-antitoxin system PemK/MazF family toxin [Acidobacteriota bacterium]